MLPSSRSTSPATGARASSAASESTCAKSQPDRALAAARAEASSDSSDVTTRTVRNPSAMVSSVGVGVERTPGGRVAPDPTLPLRAHPLVGDVVVGVDVLDVVVVLQRLDQLEHA